MNKQEIILAIRSVLTDKMQVPHLAAFCEDTKLNEELYMDSVLVLQLIVHLELDLGLAVPEEAVAERRFSTVGALAEFLSLAPVKSSLAMGAV